MGSWCVYIRVGLLYKDFSTHCCRVNITSMDIEALKTLALVAQQGSFAAAARMMNVDPSAISRIIAHTENNLGFRLFQRTTRALTITEEGDTYLRRIAPLLEELEFARDEASQTMRAPTGTLKMTSSVAFTHECIVPHLGEFHQNYPEIRLELQSTDKNIDIIASGIDLAVRLTAAPNGHFICTRLLNTHYVVCASPDYLAQHGPIVDPRELIKFNCLRFALPEFKTSWRFKAEGSKAFDVAIDGHIIISNALSLRRAAIDGLGPVLLADWLVGKDLLAGRLVELFPGHQCTGTDFDTGVWALYPDRKFLPQRVRVMIDFLREKLANQ